MCTQIQIAQPEPRAVRVERRKLLVRPERLASPSPSPLPIERVAEPIGHRIRVGRDVQSVDHDVVCDVDDDAEVLTGYHTGEPAEELPRADAAGQRRHLHERVRVVGSREMADAIVATRTSAARRALARAGAGKSLSLDELTTLCEARGDDLVELMAIAARQRDLGWGDTVTYSRKVFVPLTMLCRDHCHYCTFAKPPAKLESPFLTPEQVLDIASRGRELECKEALFTLGGRPAARYPGAREWLAAYGYDSTLEYVRAMSIRLIEETGLLPHLNPGVMSWEEMARLKHVSASMGLMLETSSDRLSNRGGPHFGS